MPDNVTIPRHFSRAVFTAVDAVSVPSLEWGAVSLLDPDQCLAESGPIAGRLLVVSWSIAGRFLADCWSFPGRFRADMMGEKAL